MSNFRSRDLSYSYTCHIVVHVEAHLGDGVGTADVQHQLVVDEQVHVIVTFEVEEQSIIHVVDELTVGLDHIVVVPVPIADAVGLQLLDGVFREVGLAGACVISGEPTRRLHLLTPTRRA